MEIMNIETQNDRVELLNYLVLKLQECNLEINLLLLQVENDMNDIMQEVVNSNADELKGVICDYRQNLDDMKTINLNMIKSINEWYSFRLDPKLLTKLTYPILFLKFRSLIRRNYEKANKNISELLINNRFINEKYNEIKESITIAIKNSTKSASGYQNFVKSISLRNDIIDKIKFLIPTFPALCPITLDCLKPDKTLSKVIKVMSEQENPLRS